MRIFSGKYRGRKLVCPKDGVRPTAGRVREALFNIVGPAIEGMRVLDIFAGTGAVGIEALSRGAASVTFVDTHTDILKKNLPEEARIIEADFEKALERLEGEQFDLIFADPPYKQGLGNDLLRLIDQSTLLAPKGQLFIEEAEMGNVSLKTLTLKRKRPYGKTSLYEFIINAPH